MIIRDALYGSFNLPEYLGPLIETPEFKRLSDVRLININSATLTSLADVRRYSHTLGVVRLALLNSLVGLTENEFKAFLASIIVHDAGTPAFAHLFEYFLADRFGWDHEEAASELLEGRHHPDGHYHQIFHSQTLAFEKACQKSKIDFELVLSFMRRKHRYSALIFGSLDFDNLDNVARMNWMLGERFSLDPILRLAANLDVGIDGSLLLSQDYASDVEIWQRLRAAAYTILVHDGPTVAAQAVLSAVIASSLKSGVLDESDWHYDDYTFLQALKKDPQAKKILQRDFLTQLPQMRMFYHEKDSPALFEGISRERLIELIVEYSQQRLGKTAYGYVFRDRGTFSKSIKFADPQSRATWSVGGRSASLFFYAFQRGKAWSPEQCSQAGNEFRDWVEGRL